MAFLRYTQGTEFALNDNFNGIRDFIRWGNVGRIRYVEVQGTPILHDEKRFGMRQTKGHMVTLGWDLGRRTLLSQVTLFNATKYRVVFCDMFRGLYREIAIGHHFDTNSTRIEELVHLPKGIWVP